MDNGEKGLEVLPPPSNEYIAKAEARSLNFLNGVLWRAMEKAATAFLQSGALPQSIKNVPQLMMMMQAGYEMGLQPLEAINSFYFVNGKLALYGDMAIALVMRAGHKIEWGTCNATTATVKITRGDNGQSMESTFTMQMVKERGLDKNPIFAKYPENMLKFKAFHMTAKFLCPDALHNNNIKEVVEAEQEDYIAATAKAVETVKAEPTVVQGHKPLGDALKAATEQPEAQEEAKKDSKSQERRKKIQKEAETEGIEDVRDRATDGVEEKEEVKEESKAVMHDKYKMLVEKEMTKEGLTPVEKMWMGKYQAQNKKA